MEKTGNLNPKYDVKKGNVADKDYMYFGYWLQIASRTK